MGARYPRNCIILLMFGIRCTGKPLKIPTCQRSQVCFVANEEAKEAPGKSEKDMFSCDSRSITTDRYTLPQ